MFLGPFQVGGDFRDEGITGVRRFLDKVWVLAHEAALTADTSPELPDAVRRKSPTSGWPRRATSRSRCR